MQPDKLITLLGRSTPKHPQGRTALLQIHSRADAKNGFNGVYDKYRIVGEIVQGQQRRGVHLFEKETRGEARIYYNTYLEAKRAGISVPDSMRVLDEDRIIMTDYVHQGVAFFGKAMYMAYKDATKETPLPEALSYIKALPLTSIRTFLRATSNMERIRNIVNDQAQRATSKGFILPYDEIFEIATWPSGKWKVMLLDLHMAKTGYYGSDLESSNNDKVQRTILRYTEMREFFREKHSREPQFMLRRFLRKNGGAS